MYLLSYAWCRFHPRVADVDSIKSFQNQLQKPTSQDKWLCAQSMLPRALLCRAICSPFQNFEPFGAHFKILKLFTNTLLQKREKHTEILHSQFMVKPKPKVAVQSLLNIYKITLVNCPSFDLFLSLLFSLCFNS